MNLVQTIIPYHANILQMLMWNQWKTLKIPWNFLLLNGCGWTYMILTYVTLLANSFRLTATPRQTQHVGWYLRVCMLVLNVSVQTLCFTKTRMACRQNEPFALCNSCCFELSAVKGAPPPSRQVAQTSKMRHFLSASETKPRYSLMSSACHVCHCIWPLWLRPLLDAQGPGVLDSSRCC